MVILSLKVEVRFVNVPHKDFLGLEFYSSGIGLSVVSLCYAAWHQFHAVQFVSKLIHLPCVVVLEQPCIVVEEDRITETRTVVNDEIAIEDKHHIYSTQPSLVQPSPVDMSVPDSFSFERARDGVLWGIH